MPTLEIEKTYTSTKVEAQDLENAKDSILTFLNTTKVDEDNILDSTFTSAFIKSNSVNKSVINSDQITSTILKSSISVDADRAVTTAKMVDNIVENRHIPDNELGNEKTSPRYAIGSTVSSFVTSNNNLVDTGLSVTYTATKADSILIFTIGYAADGYFSPVAVSSTALPSDYTTNPISIHLYKNGVSLHSITNIGTVTFAPTFVSGFCFYDDSPGLSANTYKIYVQSHNHPNTKWYVVNSFLMVREF
jgi:flagellin-like hook-associated protein FlgL